MEVYRQVPILYSLGNFTLGARGRLARLKDPLWRHGWIADIRLERGRAARVDLIPIAVDNEVARFQPRLANPALLPGILQLANQRFGTRVLTEGDRVRWTLPR